MADVKGAGSLYERLGDAVIREAITRFYERAFTDGIIGHFCFGFDRAEITAAQIDFATAMLGGPRRYRGKPLETAHRPFHIAVPHFRRRQRMMAEVLDELGVEAELRDGWLRLEENLRPLIMGTADSASCQPPAAE